MTELICNRASPGRRAVHSAGALRAYGNECGAVLFVALIMLLVLTLIGVAGMNTTLLEEKMAGNSQERTRSFEAAETGIAVAFSDPKAFDPNASVHIPNGGGSTTIGTSVARYEADTNFKTWVEHPPRGSESEELWSHDMRAAHFEVTSTGTAGGDAETRLFGGGYQVARGK